LQYWRQKAKLGLAHMRPLCIVVTGEPPLVTRKSRGGFAALIRQAIGAAWSGPWLEIDAWRAQPLPSHDQVSGVVVTGSAASVTTPEPWMTPIEDYLVGAVERAKPVLGICFGHQLLGRALGGAVERNPRGREIGTVLVEVDKSDPLLDGGVKPFLANMTHVDSVTELPQGARVLARTALEPFAALRFAETAWGIQFHPEIDAQVMNHYIQTRREQLAVEGLDAEKLVSSVRETPASTAVLTRFAELVGSEQG
jgi:GMP synthase (glutamine-hydrolysing)